MARTKKVKEAPKAPEKIAKTNKPKKNGKKEVVKEPSVEKSISKRKKKRNFNKYNRFIYQILKQTHNDVGITKKAMTVTNDFAVDMIEKFTKESASLIRMHKNVTFTEREVKAAARFLLPGELFTMAIAEGEKALQKYKASIASDKQRKKAEKENKGGEEESSDEEDSSYEEESSEEMEGCSEEEE